MIMSALPQLSPQDETYYPNHNASYLRRSQERGKQKLTSNYRSKKVTDQQKIQPIFPASPADLPKVKQLPVKIQILLFLQRGSFVLAFTLIASSIAVYISTVRIPQIWSKEYRNLETLQRQERQLTAINETLKQKIAQQAENAENNLVPLTSTNAIFVPPASIVPRSGANSAKNSQNHWLARDIPLGY
jgi:NADH:ubiquinone oxidoreductase subunit 5 (subunit L)/multisubunit Na+/H+ antiporter MnhA subunit